eukprot:XP_011668456.1 PREDICTED: uncharacterized protein LOC105440231 [Strongylocentrotus purpuratus]
MSDKSHARSRTILCRTILWCVPRSVSTALARCLSAIGDNQIWFEPFCYCYLAKVEFERITGRKLPKDIRGNEQTFLEASSILQKLTASNFKPDFISYPSIKRKLEEADSPHVFVKEISNGYVDELRFLPRGYRHAFLIRHPLRTISSFRTSVFHNLLDQGKLDGEAANETTFDIVKHNPYYASGFHFKEVHTIWKFVRENMDRSPIVIDGDDLLANPADLLPKICRVVGLPYDERLLTFDPSIESLNSWVTGADDMLMNIVNFYNTAMTTTHFIPAKEMPRRDQLTPDVIRCVDEAMSYYTEMYETRIKLS